MKRIFTLLMVVPFLGFAQTHTFELKKYISPKTNTMLKPGQMSKDGKYLYVPIVDTSKNKNFVYTYKIKKSGKYKLGSKLEIAKLPEDNDFSGQVSFTGNGLTMVSVGTSMNSWQNNDLYIFDREDDKMPFWNVRTIGEINEYEKAEVYPWISGDGLRLYYCFNYKIYLAKKKEGDRSFKFPSELILDFNDEILSCFLSADELKLYFVSGGAIYKASRADKKNNFSKPVLMANDLEIDGFISSFSIDENEKLATLYYSGNELNDSDESATYMLLFKVKAIK